MRKSHRIVFVVKTFLLLLLILAGASVIIPARQSFPYIRLYPTNTATIRGDNLTHAIYRIEGDSVAAVRVYLPWDSTVTVDITTKQKRKTILDTISAHLPGDLFLGRLTLRVMEYHVKADTIRDTFQLGSRINARELLRTDSTMPLTRRLLVKDAVQSDLRVEGWKEIVVRPDQEREGNCSGRTVAFAAELSPGLNTIVVQMLGRDATVAAADTLSVFYALGIDPESAPSGFSSEPFHTASNDSACGSCHAEAAGEVSGSGTLKCESCHAAQQRQKFVHALIASNDCATCHTTDPGSGYALTYSAEEANSTCFTCHDSLQTATDGKPVIHPPFEGDVCTSCHSPHASGNTRMLRKPVNRLCLTCHDDKGDNNHPVVFHPAGGRPDPRDASRELTCASCHNPHASDNNRLLNSPGGYFALCQGCHKK